VITACDQFYRTEEGEGWGLQREDMQQKGFGDLQKSHGDVINRSGNAGGKGKKEIKAKGPEGRKRRLTSAMCVGR